MWSNSGYFPSVSCVFFCETAEGRHWIWSQKMRVPVTYSLEKLLKCMIFAQILVFLFVNQRESYIYLPLGCFEKVVNKWERIITDVCENTLLLLIIYFLDHYFLSSKPLSSLKGSRKKQYLGLCTFKQYKVQGAVVGLGVGLFMRCRRGKRELCVSPASSLH